MHYLLVHFYYQYARHNEDTGNIIAYMKIYTVNNLELQ